MNDLNCDDCKEHSGVVARLSAGDELMNDFKAFMKEQTKRSYQILVGIIFCLLTGIISIAFNFANDKPTRQTYYKNSTQDMLIPNIAAASEDKNSQSGTAPGISP